MVVFGATGEGSGSPVLCSLTIDTRELQTDSRIALGSWLEIEDTGEPKPSPVAPSGTLGR